MPILAIHSKRLFHEQQNLRLIFSFCYLNHSLESNFAEFGTVTSAKIMMDRDSGRSKGFGFVEMASADASQAAIQALNGMSVDGRSIVVNLAKPREEGSRSGGGREFRAILARRWLRQRWLRRRSLLIGICTLQKSALLGAFFAAPSIRNEQGGCSRLAIPPQEIRRSNTPANRVKQCVPALWGMDCLMIRVKK